MKSFAVPTRNEVSSTNQAIFDTLKKNMGMVPNLFATMALSENALATYVAYTTAKSSLKAKEKEVVNLVVSQVNDCDYCSSAHTAISKLNGFTGEQILELRSGTASFDPKLDALVRFAKAAAVNKGHVAESIREQFFTAGYTPENMIDVVLVIGDKIITNYLYALTHIPIDFPEAPKLALAE